MLSALASAEELVMAAGERLGYRLSREEIADMARVAQPTLGTDIFAAGREEVEAIPIPKDPNDLAKWSEIRDSRYLSGSVQVRLLQCLKGAGAARKRELQNVLALIFRAVRAK